MTAIRRRRKPPLPRPRQLSRPGFAGLKQGNKRLSRRRRLHVLTRRPKTAWTTTSRKPTSRCQWILPRRRVQLALNPRAPTSLLPTKHLPRRNSSEPQLLDMTALRLRAALSLSSAPACPLLSLERRHHQWKFRSPLLSSTCRKTTRRLRLWMMSHLRPWTTSRQTRLHHQRTRLTTPTTPTTCLLQVPRKPSHALFSRRATSNERDA